MSESHPTDYAQFLQRKSQIGNARGFKATFLPDCMFGFQKHLAEWNVWQGCSADYADCGLGKSLIELVVAENAIRHTNRPALIMTPLAVSNQTEREAKKFGIDAKVSKDGKPHKNITITNVERLHLFNPDDYSFVAYDESSGLKNFTGARRKQITRFMSKMPYRLLATATPSPNDYVELGTSSEALGELTYSEMLKRFFQQLDDKGQKRELKLQYEAEALIEHDPSYFKKLAYRVAQTIGQWRLRHHAVTHFWRWVASWARACRMPSDLGFSNDGFVLPELRERDHLITPESPPPGEMFNVPAFGMQEERAERRRTITERTEYVAKLVDHNRPAVVWCQMNDEADRLEEIIPDAKQIAGRTPDDRKVELYDAFTSGELRVLIIKPKIGALGLNWQHCNHVVTFASHSYEQYYQSIRRCWRFGQKLPVQLDVIATEGEVRVLANMRAKAKRATEMFKALVQEMNNATRIVNQEVKTKTEVPTWLSTK